MPPIPDPQSGPAPPWTDSKHPPPTYPPPPPPHVEAIDPFKNIGNVFSFIFGLLFFLSETLAMSESNFNSLSDIFLYVLKKENKSENNRERASINIELNPSITITQSGSDK